MKFEIEIDDQYVDFIKTPEDPMAPKIGVFVEEGGTPPTPVVVTNEQIIKALVMDRIQQNIRIAYEYKTRSVSAEDMLAAVKES